MKKLASIIIILVLIVITVNAEQKNGYYKIKRDSVETWRQINKSTENIKTTWNDTIIPNAKELSNDMANGIKENGFRSEMKTHRNFYAPIVFFVIMILIWLKTRDKR